MHQASPRIKVAGYLSLDTIVCPYGKFEDVPGGGPPYTRPSARVVPPSSSQT